MTAPARILIVEDDAAIARALGSSLQAAGYRIEVAATAQAALDAVAREAPDAVVLDLMLPDGHGLDVCRRMREWTRTPVIVVSAMDAEDDMVRALDAGADDYVTKPFALGELLARLRAALRRATPPPDDVSGRLRFGSVELDMRRRVVMREGTRVPLTRREYEVVLALAREPGRVLTHRALLRAAWGEGDGSVGSLRFHVAALRRKLEEDPADPRHIVTETGVGYRLLLEPW